jgi:hypothetical protein
MTAIDTGSLRASARLWGTNYALLTGTQVVALCDALDEERQRVEVLQTYLWRIRDAVMHEGGWCYDYRTEEGARIAEAVNTIWREARDAGYEPFARAARAEEGGTS